MTETLIRLDQQLYRGISPALPDKQGTVIENAENIVFDEMSIQPLPGQRVLFPKIASDPISGMTSLVQAGVDTLYWGDPAALYKWTAAAGPSVVTNGFTGTVADHWSLEPWGNWVAATNNVDVPQLDKNDGNGFQAMGGSPPATVKKFVKYKAFMLALGIAGDPNGLAWCDEDDIEDWTPVASNFAGDIPLRDMSSPIITGVALGDGVIIYGEDDCQIARFIGTPNVIGAFPLLRGIGAVGTNSICRVKNFHYGMGRRGFWRSDGVDFQYIDNPAVRGYVQEQLGEESCSCAVAWHLPHQQLVVFFYPDDGQPGNKAGLAFNYSNDSWWHLNYGRSAVLEASVFTNPMAGTSDGYIVDQPVAHTPPGILGSPLLLTATASLSFGFGQFGFGVGPFGGVYNING